METGLAMASLDGIERKPRGMAISPGYGVAVIAREQ